MVIPALTKEDISKALKYIDENGVPDQNKSTKYVLVTKEGKEYPPKYVIAVADYLINGKDISTNEFNAIEAKKFLQSLGFIIQNKKFALTITADEVVSTDSRFTLNNLGLGDNYKPCRTYFQDATGQKTERTRKKNENTISNRTMPSLACQIFEKQLDALSADEKANFLICQYSQDGYVVRGIYTSEDEYKSSRRNTMVYFTYNYGNGKQFVFEYWNLFSTIQFVQECLKRFGKVGDKFVLEYIDKPERERVNNESAIIEEPVGNFEGYKNKYSTLLIESKNIIFRGAPGTGKTYLAKEIAADIVSNGYTDNYDDLAEEQKQQIEFVQFHPSYDYTDFVEGLRPKINDDGSMGFKLRDGIFKAFVDRARRNYENSQKSIEIIEKELSVQEAIEEFFSEIELGVETFKTARGSEFTITEIDDDRIHVYIPSNAKANSLLLDLDKIKRMLEAEIDFELKDIKDFFGHARRMQDHSYYLVIYNEIKKLKSKKKKLTTQVKKEEKKNYVFIIDEINRGEISKIFGELFFTVDPGYRGTKGKVKTQYANLHPNPNDQFYIPDNVYIIGTMNDIDRSVDSFDFAMRRRFRFIELKANENIKMLDELGDALKIQNATARMNSLNNAIMEVEDLNENYQIGASYFLKLKELSFDQLWTDYLKPLLQEYVRGMYDEAGIMSKFEKAYGYNRPNDGDANGDNQDQG